MAMCARPDMLVNGQRAKTQLSNSITQLLPFKWEVLPLAVSIIHQFVIASSSTVVDGGLCFQLKRGRRTEIPA